MYFVLIIPISFLLLLSSPRDVTNVGVINLDLLEKDLMTRTLVTKRLTAAAEDVYLLFRVVLSSR